MTRIEVNGIRLNIQVAGRGPELVLLLHDLGGDASVWEPCLEGWSGLTLARVDLIGHGRSDSPPDAGRYSVDAAIGDIVAILDRLGSAKAAVVGYAMGGVLALQMALSKPNRVWALVLESVSPGVDDAEERAALAQADNELAGVIEQQGLEAFVSRWQALPVFEPESSLPQEVRDRQRRQRLSASPQGLANCLRVMAAGSHAYLIPRLRDLSVPTLVVAGALAGPSAAQAQRLAGSIPGALMEIIPDAGHAVHLHQPRLFGQAARDFLLNNLPVANTTGARSSI